MGNPFFEATAVSAAGDGRYTAELDETWNLRPLPQGGVVTAIALRAMEAGLGHPEQRLRTFHTTFVAQVAHGAMEVDVELLRRGRSMSHARAEVRNVGSSRGHITTAVFGGPRRGFEFTDVQPPEGVPHWDDSRSHRDPLPEGVEGFEPMPFWERVIESRSAIAHAPWDDYEPESSMRALWYHFDEPPFADDGTLDPLALVVMSDTMPGAVGEKLGDRDRAWFAPSVDLTFHLLDECRSPWVLGVNTARHAGGGYASADMALWDYGPDFADAPRLVAYATQLFLFSFVE